MNRHKVLAAWLGALACACGGAKENEMQDPLAMAGSGAPVAGQAGAAVAGVGGTTGLAAGTSAGLDPQPTAGTSNAGNAGTGSTEPRAGTGGIPEPACPECTIPPECQGFPFEGLKYSPGGSELPNKCEPFHPTTNNPYAVRCIDVMPDFDSGFPGDEYCILPPPPELGMQVGIHPQGTPDQYWEQIWAGDYSGYETTDPLWVLPAGAERTQNYRGHATNPEPMNYYRTYFRMRTGSHHNIITMHEAGMPDEWIPGIVDALPGLFDSSSGMVMGVLGGQQRPDDSTPVTLDAPPEDEGLYLVFPAAPSIIYNMHHFNTGDGPILREGWSNIWWAENATTRASWYMGLEPSQVIFLNVPAGQARDFHYAWNVSTDIRLIRVFGHRHFWTTNFSAWVERASGETELLYQSYDWQDMPTYRYDSAVVNPPLNPEGRSDGAVSGVTMLRAGDQLHFNCHVEFNDARASTDAAAPAPSELGSLRFANQAYNGEMCIQFGNVSGGSLGLPAISSTPVPDFAKVSR